MVDIASPEAKAKKKFSPKFDEAPTKKKAKKNKQPEDASMVPKKKMKLENDENSSPNPVKEKKFSKSLEKKKKIKFNEEVKVREFKNVEGKKVKVKKVAKDGKVTKDEKKVSKKDKKKEVVKLNKKETREKQKKVKEIRKKFKQEDVFDIGIKAKKVWEEVRREDCPEQKKEKLITELHSLVQGNIKKIIYAHDTVRVIECLMALGTPEIRTKLFEELKDDIIEMSKSKYAHFFVQKMLRYGTKEQKNIIYKAMQGQMVKLVKNKTAGYVVEAFYNDVATGPQRNAMLQEFFDLESAHFKEPELKNAPEVLSKYPNRKSDCVKNLHKYVEVLIQKGAYNHSLVHTVIYNYLLVGEGKQRAEVIESLREALVHMAHSREGAYSALQCIWHGTAKDRKAIIKSFKTFMLKTAQEEYGHMVLLGMFDSVDDTKIVGKAVIGELMENLDELFQNKFGVRVLKYLFCGRDSTYLNKDMFSILEKGDGNEHSKKESSVRHKELLSVSAATVLNYITKGIPSNLYDAPTTITLTCIINNSPPSADLDSLFDKLAKQAAKPFSKDDAEPNIVENPASSMMLKKIIAKDKDRSERGENTFSSFVLKHLQEEGTESWVRCNRGCFLFVNLLGTTLPDVQTKVKAKLKQFNKVLKGENSQGAKILMEKIA